MIGFSLPIEWPDDPTHRKQFESDVLGFLEQRLKSSAPFDALLWRTVPGVDHALVASITAHWSDPATRPDVVARFLSRYAK